MGVENTQLTLPWDEESRRLVEMFGILPPGFAYARETLTIGYREVTALGTSSLMAAGARVGGHEFDWSFAEEPPEELAEYRLMGQNRVEGICIGQTLGSYVHLNLAGAPEIARHFVVCCAQVQQAGVSSGATSNGRDRAR